MLSFFKYTNFVTFQNHEIFLTKSSQLYPKGAELGFSDRGCKLLVNCISTYVKPLFSWFQVESLQKTAGAPAATVAPALTPPLLRVLLVKYPDN